MTRQEAKDKIADYLTGIGANANQVYHVFSIIDRIDADQDVSESVKAWVEYGD